MLTIGLTGNIGSGKSTVAKLLVAHGAALVDADQVARQVVEPGAVAYQPLVDRFGAGILDAEGRIDRPALAARAFGDPDELAASMPSSIQRSALPWWKVRSLIGARIGSSSWTSHC